MKAALREFTANGYENASTNQIVEEAGIAKGSLFYYFETKQELYRYLIEYSLDFVTEEFLNKLEQRERKVDLIENLRRMSRLKLQAYSKNPEVFNFLGAIYLSNEAADLPEELISRTERTKRRILADYYQNVDTSLFRQDISPRQITRLIRWSIEGYERELIQDIRGKELSVIDFQPYWDEYHDFLDLLKKIYYR